MRISDILGRIVGSQSGTGSSSDVSEARLDGEARLVVERFRSEALADPSYVTDYQLQNYQAGREILESPADLQIAVFLAGLKALRESMLSNRVAYADTTNDFAFGYRSLLPALLRKRPPFNESHFRRMLVYLSEAPGRRGPSLAASAYAHWVPIASILLAIERRADQPGLIDGLKNALVKLQQELAGGPYRYPDAEDRRIIARIDSLLGNAPDLPLEAGEPWADASLSALSGLADEPRAAWRALLQHCAGVSGTKPSAKWRAEARKRIEAVGDDRFREHIREWIPMAGARTDAIMSEVNGRTLKGLAWCCAVLGESTLSRPVADAAEGCYRKIVDFGARAAGAGNACVTVLSELSGMEPIAELARLRLRVKNRAGLELIGKALETAARKSNLPTADLEELVVPTFGLDEQGCLRAELGACAAEFEVDGARASELRWFGPEGTLRKSVPAEVKRDHGAELKAVKLQRDEIGKMLSAQRDRVERLLMSERRWPLRVWRERYLDHPLLGSMSRRLIWHFSTESRSNLGIWDEGRMVDSSGRPLEWPSDDGLNVTVRLWHPIGFTPQVVLDWRIWLETHHRSQPFKQAHREIYILTDAELATGTYSNRFAAHVIKQHQFNALCGQRGWRYTLQGGFDGGTDTATLELPDWNLKAEFWIERPWDDGDMAESGIYLHVLTDQVRFQNREGVQLSLTDVPAIVFTEVMRDVDLFVGVTSIGNDPAWQDAGRDARYADYWRDHAFGELTESAAARKELLGRLLPRLKIADRCAIEGKFLIVRGSLHTYKIHLSSGNILMSPNDQYLCIVPARASAATEHDAFLPFDGDRTFSLILSKAFLLADDLAIKDATILSQIRRN